MSEASDIRFIDSLHEICYEDAALALQRSVRERKEMPPHLEILDAGGDTIATIACLDRSLHARVYWEDALLYCARVLMVGLARAEYVSFIFDAYFKTTDEMLKRGQLQDEREAGDTSVRDGLVVITQGRSDVRLWTTPYIVNRKRRVVFDCDARNKSKFGGSVLEALREAATAPRTLDMIAKLAPTPMSVAELVDTLAHKLGKEGQSVPHSVVRAHQDVAALRVICDTPEMEGSVLVLYSAEDDDAKRIVDNSMARYAEFNENLISAHSLDEMIEKFERMSH